MDFEVSIDEHADAYSIISVHGEIDLYTAPKVQYAIERAAGSDGVVILDMQGVEFMDSTALSALMRAKDTLQRQGISLRLAALSEPVERILGVTGFKDYFDIFPSRDAAIDSS